MFEGRLSRATLLSTVLFAIAVALGVLAVRQNPAFGEQLVSSFRDQVAAGILSDSAPVLFFGIFLNNLVSCVALFLGGASFGLVPVLVVATNGLVIGGVAEAIRAEKGTAFILAGLLPHGILELPAVLVSAGLGLLLAESLARELVRGETDAAVEAFGYGRLFALYVVPIVALAAGVEAFITPHILQLVS